MAPAGYVTNTAKGASGYSACVNTWYSAAGATSSSCTSCNTGTASSFRPLIRRRLRTRPFLSSGRVARSNPPVRAYIYYSAWPKLEAVPPHRRRPVHIMPRRVSPASYIPLRACSAGTSSPAMSFSFAARTNCGGAGRWSGCLERVIIMPTLHYRILATPLWPRLEAAPQHIQVPASYCRHDVFPRPS